jgi:hypothetical protein
MEVSSPFIHLLYPSPSASPLEASSSDDSPYVMTGALVGLLYPFKEEQELDFEDEVDNEVVEVILKGSW